MVAEAAVAEVAAAEAAANRPMEKYPAPKGLLYPNERIDDLQLGGLVIIQDPSKFAFGIDAVMLANFICVQAGEKALDLGTGTGIIPLLLSAKGSGVVYEGIEIQEDMADMAQRSVLLNIQNGFLAKGLVSIKHGDLRELKTAKGLPQYDIVTCNPPYIPVGGGIINANTSLKISRHEFCCTLEDVLAAAARILRPGGRFAMVHRPQRLADITTAMRTFRLEPKRLQMVHPAQNKPPTHCLIEARRGAKPYLEVLPPIIGL